MNRGYLKNGTLRFFKSTMSSLNLWYVSHATSPVSLLRTLCACVVVSQILMPFPAGRERKPHLVYLVTVGLHSVLLTVSVKSFFPGSVFTNSSRLKVS